MARPTVSAAAANVYTASVTPGGSDNYAIAGITARTSPVGPAPVDVTWGGTALTSLIAQAGLISPGFQDTGARLGGTATPGSGAKAIATSDTAACNGRAGVSLAGVNGTTPIASTGQASADAGSTSISVSVSPTADQLVVVWYFGRGANSVLTAGANTTVQAQNAQDNQTSAILTATGSVNFTLDVAQDYGLLYAVVNGTGGGGGGTLPVPQVVAPALVTVDEWWGA